MSADHLLAINLGSVTLKAAVFTVHAQGFDAGLEVREFARIEVPTRGDPYQDLALAIDALPADARSPALVVHRIVHGGPYSAGVELDDATLTTLHGLVALDPLHQPAALALADVARSRWPDARHGAAFDTAFHANLAPWSRRLPLPADLNDAGVRRFGFHGLAFASALRQLGGFAPASASQRVVVAHLGGGCSIAAIKGGHSVDTTMGMTPLGGVPMATRSGDLDPGIVFHLLRNGSTVAQLEQRLMYEAGLAGIAGHGDVRRLLQDTRPDAILALEQFAVRIAQAIAAMAVAAGGMDHIVFCGGSGSHAPALRARIADWLAPLSVVLDPDRNQEGATRVDAGHGPAVWRIDVNEELELAESVRAWLFPSPHTPGSFSADPED